MGSPKQASALVKIVNQIRRSRTLGNLSPDAEAKYRAEVLAMTLSEVRAQFTEYNAITGFDRDTAPATTDQRRRISQLEIAAYGARRTTYQDQLSFLAASDLIASLVAMRDDARATVQELENIANGAGILQ